MVHCTYECPSIMRRLNDKNLVGSSYLKPDVGFDWYVTGYCVSHFDVEWGLLISEHATDENIDLLVKGLRSSPTVKGKIQELHIYSLCKYLIQLEEFCQLHTLCLHYLHVDNNGDDVILCQLIEHQSRLRRVNFQVTVLLPSSFIPLLLGLSSLEELALRSFSININTELLPHSNTNLKKLIMTSDLIQPLATLFPNMTSLTYLEIFGPVTDSDMSVLIATVQSLHMLEELHLVGYRHTGDKLDSSELVLAAGNSQLKKLRIDSSYYDNL